MAKRKSYAEVHGTWVYNWLNILHNIEHRLFTKREAQEWMEASASWVTCACGNQCAEIQRNRNNSGAPDDPQLTDLGSRFCGEVVAAIENVPGAVDRARAILSQIEKRAAEVLKRLDNA